MIAIILIITGILLIVLNINAIKKDKNSFKVTLSNREESIREYEIEIGEVRREFSETILELQKEIERIKAEKESLNNKHIDIQKSKEDNTWGNEELIELMDKSVDLSSIKGTKNLSDTEVNEEIEEGFQEHEEKLEDKVLHNELNKSDVIYENSSGKYNAVRINEIRGLLQEDFTVEEIAEKIGVGKGEVLLIKDLYIK